MKKKLKNGLLLTSALSASMFNTPALISDAMAQTVNSSNNISTPDQKENDDKKQSSDKNDNSNNDVDNTSSKNEVVDKKEENKVSSDNSIGPGYYNNRSLVIATKSLIDETAINGGITTFSGQDFINSVASGAINGWKNYKVLPSVTIAQAIIESGWGQSGLTQKANNLFGIKGRYNGQYVLMPTQEYINGNWVTVNAEFRKYPSRNESVEDHGNFLVVNSRYHNLLGVTDYKKVTSLLQQDGYATDPNYPRLLNSIIESNGLTRYDGQALNSNIGSLDEKKFTGSSLHVRGWNAADDSKGKNYSYVFLLDASTKKEVQRVKINRESRTDVKNAYPNIYNSGNSGFSANFKVTPNMYGKKYILMSRYTSDVNGDYDTADHIFSDEISLPDNGRLDEVKISPSEFSVRGWHISQDMDQKKYTYLFLMDPNTKKEVKRIKINRTSRPDVKNLFSDIKTSDISGFNTNIKLDKNMYGKKYILMSRYTSDPNGNNDANDHYYDQVISMPNAVTKASSMDHLNIQKNKIHLDGWQIDETSKNKPYSYIIMLDKNTGKEVKRFKINRQKRNDVKDSYPYIYNAENSGFSLDIPIEDFMKGHTYKFISRYSSNPSGEGDVSEVRFDNELSVPGWENGNHANLDGISVDTTSIKVRGWHATSESNNKKYSYLFLLDAKTGKEVKRLKIDRTVRNDVGSTYSNIRNSKDSGFDNQFKLDKNMYGKKYVLMSRYSSDPNGDYDVTDYTFVNQGITTPQLQSGNRADLNDFNKVNRNTIYLRGWHATSESIDKPYHYLIFLNKKTGLEVYRKQIKNVLRTDVANAYPNVYNSLNSGFEEKIMSDKFLSKDIKVISRYSGSSDGNSKYVDYWFNKDLKM